jgi:hypothetical protein
MGALALGWYLMSPPEKRKNGLDGSKSLVAQHY